MKQPINWSLVWRIALILFILVLIIGNISQCRAQTPRQYDSIINQKLIAHGIAPFTRKLLISQARVESGVYTSRLFRQHNNLYGMLHPKQRKTTSLCGCGKAEKRKGYASYSTLGDSVDDLVLWLESRKLLKVYKTTEEYVKAIRSKGYFGSSTEDYIKAIQYHNKQQSL